MLPADIVSQTPTPTSVGTRLIVFLKVSHSPNLETQTGTYLYFRRRLHCHPVFFRCSCYCEHVSEPWTVLLHLTVAHKAN